MSPLLDPTLCPDCRAPLDAGATCTGCGLRLTGPLAVQLWQTMRYAAALVDQLRREPVLAPAALDLPAAPPPSPPRPRRSLSGGSVPLVLFMVGGLCLLVAAVVFVAVTWSSLGLGARTSILLGVTGLFGGAATVLTRRGLRGAAETFWLVTSALVAIDLTAAYGAGLLGFDAMPARHAVALGGGTLLALGLGATAGSRTTALRTLYGMSVVAVVGALVVVASEAWTAPAVATATTVSIAALVALAAFARALRLDLPAYGFAGLSLVSWMVLVGEGLARAESLREGWWTGTSGWPLLVAAGLAALVTFRRELPTEARMVGAGAALTTLALFVLAPPAQADTRLVLAAAVLLALAATAGAATRVWALAAGVLTSLGIVLLGGSALLRPLLVAGELPARPTADRAQLLLPPPDSLLSAWTAVVAAAAVVVAVLGLGRFLDAGTRAVALRSWYVVAPTALATGAATAVLESTPQLATAVAVWAGVLLLLGVLAAAVRGAWAAPTVLAAGYLALVGLRLAAPSDLLLALFATGLAAGLAVGYRRTASGPELRGALAVATVLATAIAATQWPGVLGASRDAAAVTVVLVALAWGLLARELTRAEVDRACVEVTALVVALAGCAVPVDLALVSVLLTLTGTAAALTSVLHLDRDEVAWIGVLILGGATVLRIGEHLTLPELATAPAAALLLAAGLRRLLLDPSASSRRALGSGLVLATLPTLVLVVDDPVSTRSVVIGVLGVVMLAVGAARRWSAPLLAGGAALAVLALVHLGPVAAALPRWISLGTLGVALLVVAVTWEQRRQNLASAERYLDALR